MQQHPGYRREGGEAACVAPVSPQRLPVEEGQRSSVLDPKSKQLFPKMLKRLVVKSTNIQQQLDQFVDD